MLYIEKDCKTCKQCTDKEVWACEYEEPCMNHIFYEPECPTEKFNEIET